MALKEKLRKNQLTLGSWVSIGHQSVIEIMACGGFEWLTLDMEHSVIELELAQHLIGHIQAGNMEALVRVGKNEEVIIKRKFPRLLTRVPQVATQMGKVTDSLRVAIYGEELYAEFSHRALCSILEHAQDMLDCTSKGKIPKNLLKMACRVWLDGLSDEETRQSAKNLMDPHLAGGVVDQGNTDHLKPGNPAGDGWSA